MGHIEQEHMRTHRVDTRFFQTELGGVARQIDGSGGWGIREVFPFQVCTVINVNRTAIADIEQVLREKKPFILRCMLDGIKKRQGRMVIGNRFTLSVSITEA